MTWHCCQEGEQTNKLQCGEEIHLPGKPTHQCEKSVACIKPVDQKQHCFGETTGVHERLVDMQPAHLQPEVDIDEEEGSQASMEAHSVDQGEPRGGKTLEVHAQCNELEKAEGKE